MGAFQKLGIGSPPSSRWTPALLAGALLTVLGLILAATAPVIGTPGAETTRLRQHIAGVCVVIGWVLLGVSIHALGRAPPE
ncbi:MAG: hypothetical protein ABTD50_00370 [Polyangiaceae bacterium]|jgi:MFS-type transporter involved in bile tolerance (Atg22 family)